MDACAPVFSSNALLSVLPSKEIGQLRRLLTHVRWVNGQVVYEAGERIEHVYFVDQGFASMIAEADGYGNHTGVGLVGREGMLGLLALFDPEAVSFNQMVMQVPGAARRMTAQALRDSVDGMPVLRRLLFQALEVSMAQVAQTAACNSRHALVQRLARCLLMAHDRVDEDELTVTQGSLSVLLGVRRAGVTIAMQALQETGAVSRRRGRILICDRSGLRKAACDCYGRTEAFAATVASRMRCYPPD